MLLSFLVFVWAVGAVKLQEEVESLLDVIEAFRVNASLDYGERNERLNNLTELAEETHTKRVKNIQAKRKRGEDLIEKGLATIKKSEERAANVTEWFVNIKRRLEEKKMKNQQKFARKMLRVDRMINEISATPSPPEQNEPYELCTEPSCLVDVGVGLILG